jgi:hypothetical protein
MSIGPEGGTCHSLTKYEATKCSGAYLHGKITIVFLTAR